jgi:protein-S-isoprenylcysteine O-methyltransferase Ste14
MREVGSRPPASAGRPRGIRTRSAWLLAVPFLVLARPVPELWSAGATLAVLGLLLRGWAAGTIRKDEELTTRGPYAFLRHPLYVGSFLIGIGLAAAGGHWVWPVLVVAFFVLVYQRTIAEEEERLAALFGSRYEEYARHVPALLPRPTAYRLSPVSGDAATGGFAWIRYFRNREWEALLGAVSALGLLAAKMRWLG